jgi:hypothetical protein
MMAKARFHPLFGHDAGPVSQNAFDNQYHFGAIRWLRPRRFPREVNLVAAQEPPDMLVVNIAQASSGPVQRENPSGGGLSSSLRIRLSVVFV